MKRKLLILALCFMMPYSFSLALEDTKAAVKEAAVEKTSVLEDAKTLIEDTKAKLENLNKVFKVYTDKKSADNHYAPSGWMGDFGDITIDDQSKDTPHDGLTCVKVTYTAKKTQNEGWAGVYWQNPANNWGTKKGGFDLSSMNKLTFWARGQKGKEIIQKVKIGGIKGMYPDTVEVEMGPIELTDAWQKYAVNLVGKDLSYVSGGFSWVMTAEQNPEGAVFYLDDVRFEYDPALKPQSKQPQQMPFYVYADRRSVGNHFIPSGWMGDYGDISIDAGWTEDAYLGDTCVKVVYTGKNSQGARWAGVYWQNPANNWGSVDAGYDLTQATQVTFWARGEKGGERIEEFKIGGIMGEYSDSDIASIGPVVLADYWQKYTIDLKGKDLSYLIGGFCWATNIDVNPQGCTFYLDEIKYE